MTLDTPRQQHCNFLSKPFHFSTFLLYPYEFIAERRTKINTPSQNKPPSLTFVFLITFHEELVPLRSAHPRHVQGAAVALGKALGADVFVQRLAVRSMEDDPAPQLVPEEWLEQGENHVEDVGLVHYVDVLNTEGNAILKRKSCRKQFVVGTNRFAVGFHEFFVAEKNRYIFKKWSESQ